MSAFTQGFNFGFMHGMFDRMFGGFNPFCGCNFFGGFNFTPMFFTPTYNTSIFTRYSTPMPDIQFPAMNSMPDFSIPKLDFSQSAFNYSMPNFTMSDTFVKSSNTTFASPKTTTPKKKNYAKGESAYNSLIEKYSKKYGVEEDFVRAIIKAESRFDPNAKSYAGAMGLMQLMPGTAKGLGVSDPWDPEQNINGGVKYIKQLLDKYNGNKELALAAYNAGPGNVKNGKIPQNGQTPNYVKEVIQNYREYTSA